MSYERFLTCDYLDASVQPASFMLNKCVQDPTQGYDFHCRDGDLPGSTLKRNEMNSLAIQRGHEKGIESKDSLSLKERIEKGFSNHEGFANRTFITDNGLGESTIPRGTCPQGYKWCPKTRACIQACVGCQYQDNMKSKDFNEKDPCFPQGVFDGYTNEGHLICTCGQDNKYCSETTTNLFGTDGSYSYNHKIKTTIGMPNALEKLYLFDQ